MASVKEKEIVFALAPSVVWPRRFYDSRPLSARAPRNERCQFSSAPESTLSGEKTISGPFLFLAPPFPSYPLPLPSHIRSLSLSLSLSLSVSFFFGRSARIRNEIASFTGYLGARGFLLLVSRPACSAMIPQRFLTIRRSFVAIILRIIADKNFGWNLR
jgi:hypothetical protein